MRTSVLGPASQRASRDLAAAARLAASCHRPEAAHHLADVRRALTKAEVRVVVAGEFKQGKSTLANSLLRTDVCPVDQDVVTTVPMVVRWGAQPRAFALLNGERRAVSMASVPSWVRGELDATGLQAMEVELDRNLLRRGITLVDTPGVGGLDSAHGQLTRATLSTANATLFVTDASQELTAPELEFLRDAMERCPSLCLVMTKTDLFAQWRRILDLDRAHLDRAGIDIPLVPVSSFLRMRAAATGDEKLNERSGYPVLLDRLSDAVLADADRLAAAGARQEVLFIGRQLAEHIGSEREVLKNAAQAESVVAGLTESSRRSRALLEETSSWLVVLQDGLHDLASEMEHDLKQRMRALQAEGEEALSNTDPARGWPEFEAWARKATAAAAVAHLQVLVRETEELGRTVAERFDVEHETLDVELPMSGESVRAISTLLVDFRESRLRQALGAMTAARVTYYGVVIAAAVGSAGGAAVLIPAIGVVFGAGAIFTRRLVKDEGSRQLDQRRTRARQVFRTYLDEVGFVLTKESRDAVRRTQRHLRDDFGRRARLVSQGSDQALAAARRAAAAPDRAERLDEVEHRWQQLQSLTASMGNGRG